MGKCWENASIAVGQAVPMSVQVQTGWRELSIFCWDGFHFLMKIGSKVVSWERAWGGGVYPLDKRIHQGNGQVSGGKYGRIARPLNVGLQILFSCRLIPPPPRSFTIKI